MLSSNPVQKYKIIVTFEDRAFNGDRDVLRTQRARYNIETLIFLCIIHMTLLTLFEAHSRTIIIIQDSFMIIHATRFAQPSRFARRITRSDALQISFYALRFAYEWRVQKFVSIGSFQ